MSERPALEALREMHQEAFAHLAKWPNYLDPDEVLSTSLAFAAITDARLSAIEERLGMWTPDTTPTDPSEEA